MYFDIWFNGNLVQHKEGVWYGHDIENPGMGDGFGNRSCDIFREMRVRVHWIPPSGNLVETTYPRPSKAPLRRGFFLFQLDLILPLFIIYPLSIRDLILPIGKIKSRGRGVNADRWGAGGVGIDTLIWVVGRPSENEEVLSATARM